MLTSGEIRSMKMMTPAGPGSRADSGNEQRVAPVPGRGTNPDANARFTGSTAAILFVVLAAEGFTIVRIRPLLSLHVLLGMVLVPLVVLKIGSTTYRFVHYYLGTPAYRRRGPPPFVLRVVGPLLGALTAVLLASGIIL